MANPFSARKTQGYAQGLYEESSTQKEVLGTIRQEIDGRTFAYAKNGAVALAVAKLTQSALADSNSNAETLPATPTTGAAIGATKVTITFGGAIAADAYKDGFFHVSDSTGVGYVYRIKSQPAATAGNSYTVDVQLYEPIRVALVASASVVNCTKHPQDGVLLATTTLGAAPAGVPPRAVTASYYFWNQVKGPCALLCNGTVAVTTTVEPSGTTAGAVDVTSETTYNAAIGTVICANATTKYSLINLAIPGY